ncbi:MAG TPA: hypothetical protein VFE07_12465 [Marmoricola sp.]|nr:hypothetical protein [Marmoricola sp.]
MQPTTPSRRRAAQAALVLGPILAGVSVILQPDLSGSTHDQLVAIGDSPRGAVSAVAFLVSQLPMLIAVLAIGRLLLPRAPRLSAWGTALGVLGCFGHTVFGGISMVYVVMAHDPAHLDTYAHLMDRMNSSPVMLFSAAGLLGTVIGLLLLGIGLFRTRTGPVWVGPAIWAFLVVEFVGSSISSSASYVSVLLLAAAFFTLSTLVRDEDAAAFSERETQAVG